MQHHNHAHPMPPVLATGTAPEYEKLARQLRAREWEVGEQRLTAVRQKFQRFARDLSQLLKTLLGNAGLPVVELPDGGPSCIPVMHTVAPNLRGYAPQNGNWHLGINPDGSLMEFRWAKSIEAPNGGVWETRMEIASAFTSPACCLQALDIALRDGIQRRKELEKNVDRIADECEAVGNLLRRIRREEQQPSGS